MPEWTFPISPVAASRPRVTKHGAYFAGPYKTFRKDMAEIVSETFDSDTAIYTTPLEVDVEIYVKRPKKTKLSAPRADIDNYLKAIFDSLNGVLWEDDTQIQKVYACKQWAPECYNGGYFILGVNEL